MKGKRKKKQQQNPDKFMAGSTYAAHNIFAYIFHTQHMAIIQIAQPSVRSLCYLFLSIAQI